MESTSRQRAEPRPLSDSEYQSLAEFRHALRSFLHFSEEAAKSVGVTPAKHQLMLAIRAAKITNGEWPTVGEMAESMKLRHHSMVGLVDRAEAAGLIKRAQDSEDQRRQRLVLTRKGDQKLSSLTALHRDELHRFREQVVSSLGML